MTISDEQRQAFVTSTADYVETNEEYEFMTKREAVEATVELFLNDIGATQSLLDTLGVLFNLYEDDVIDTEEQ